MTKTLGETAKKTLKSAGLHFTRQRELVLQILLRGQGHLDAYAVHDQVKHRGESMSLSTVYRILQAFRDHGLIAENHLGEDHHHYEAVSSSVGDAHYHAVCDSCGGIFEFTLPEGSLAKAEGFPEGFIVSEIELSVTGLCESCRRRGRADAVSS